MFAQCINIILLVVSYSYSLIKQTFMRFDLWNLVIVMTVIVLVWEYFDIGGGDDD